MPDESSEEDIWNRLHEAEGADRAELLQELGSRYFDRGAFAEAAASAASAAELFSAADRHDQQAQCHWGQAICYERMGQNEDALVYFARAHEVFDQILDELGSAQCLGRIADLEIGRGDYETARVSLEEAVRLALAGGEEERAADFTMDLGELLGRLGHQSQALERFDFARSVYRKLQAIRAVARADDRAAACLIDLGQLDDALGLLRNALAVAEMSGDTAFLTYARYRLGWTLQLADENEEALEHLSNAREGYGTLEDILGAASCDQIAASALAQVERYDEALDLFRRVRAVFDAAGDDDAVIRAEANMAATYKDRGDHYASMEAYRVAYARALTLGQPFLIRSLGGRLANALLKLGSPTEAAEIISEAEQYVEETDEVNETSRFAVAKARTLAALGDFEQADAIARSALVALAETTSVAVLAGAYEVAASCALAHDDPSEGRRLQAHAVALFLAAGDDDHARELSRIFLPPPSSALAEGLRVSQEFSDASPPHPSDSVTEQADLFSTPSSRGPKSNPSDSMHADGTTSETRNAPGDGYGPQTPNESETGDG